MGKLFLRLYLLIVAIVIAALAVGIVVTWALSKQELDNDNRRLAKSTDIDLYKKALRTAKNLGHITRIPYITQQHFWIAIAAYAVLLAGTLYKI